MAGGTGGHIFPALATAQALKTLDSKLDLRFFSGCREVEIEIYKREGIEPIVLPVGRFGGGLGGKITVARQVLAAYRASKKYFRNWHPFCVLGMGGYVAFATVWAAHKRGIPIVLHEQNSVLGRAHRMAARWASVLACSYPDTMNVPPNLKTAHVGNPIRPGFDSANREEARRFYDIDSSSRCLFVSGGSQGAEGINRLIFKSLPMLENWCERGNIPLSILWSCGAREAGDLRGRIDERGDRWLDVRIYDFIERMDLAYAAADLVIGRSGAGSVAETTAAGKAAIFVPFPAAIHDHQRRNAQSVVDRGGALLVDERATNADAFSQQITELLGDESKLMQMARMSRMCGRPAAAEELARLILKIGQNEAVS